MSCEYEGCAATVMLAWREPSTGSLYVQTANAGDCHVAFGRAKNPGSGRGAKFLTKEHRVTSPEERERLRSRHGIKLPRGARRLHGLALTRTLGDSFLKRERVGIIATPDVSPPVEVSTGDGWGVAVLATDGLWDVCSAEHAMGVAGKASAGEDQGKDGVRAEEDRGQPGGGGGDSGGAREAEEVQGRHRGAGGAAGVVNFHHMSNRNRPVREE